MPASTPLLLLRRPVATLLILFFVTRVLVFGASHLGAAHGNGRFDQGYADPARGAPPDGWVTPLIRWDALWYVRIAREDYAPPRKTTKYDLAFFPLYPISVRLVDVIVGNTFWAGVLVSNICALLCMLVLWRMVTQRAGRAAGLWAAAFFVVAPAGAYFSYPYTESMFCLLLALGMFSLQRGRPLWAGIAGALCSATRSTGVVVSLMLLVEAWQLRHDRRAALARVSGAATGGLGLLAYMAYCQWRYGEPLAFMTIQKEWNRHFALWGPFKAFLSFDIDPDFYLVTIAALVLCWRARRSMPTREAVGAWFLLMLPLFSGTLSSMVRFVSANIPLIVALPTRESAAVKTQLFAVSFVLMLVEAFFYGGGYAHN